MFELYLSGDRRKRDLFSLFCAEQGRLEVDTTGGSDGGSRGGSGDVGGGDSDATGDGNGARGRGGGRGNSEDRLNDLMVVIQNLARIAEDSETSGSDSALGDSKADHHHQQQMEGGGTAGRPRVSSRDMSEALARAYWSTSGDGATVRGSRTFSRTANVRSVRMTSSGGSRGFFRDQGHAGEDTWQSLRASAPDLHPRLPSQWTTSNIISEVDPSPSPQKAVGPGGSSSGRIDSIRSGGEGTNDSLRSRGASGRRLLRNASGRSAGGGGGGGGNSNNGSISGSIHHSRSCSTGSDRDLGNHHRTSSSDLAPELTTASSEGAAATVAASVFLNAASRSYKSMFSFRREGFERGPREGADGGGRRGSSSTFPSFRVGGGGAGPAGDRGGGAPRLQLSEHGVRALPAKGFFHSCKRGAVFLRFSSPARIEPSSSKLKDYSYVAIFAKARTRLHCFLCYCCTPTVDPLLLIPPPP